MELKEHFAMGTLLILSEDKKIIVPCTLNMKLGPPGLYASNYDR